MRISTRNFEGEVEVAVADTGQVCRQRNCPGFGNAFTSLTKPAPTAAEALALGLRLKQIMWKPTTGEVAVQSEVGKGATFSFSLPIISTNS